MVLDYLSALDLLHDRLAPTSYVEIGCREGVSLARARCPALAVDPDFEIRLPLHAPTRIFKETSDAFFAARDLTALLGGPFDLAFIDGMHLAEFALRDFVNLERHAHAGSVVVIDDVVPQEMAWTTREPQTGAWTGDVYKLVPLLRAARRDLAIEVFDIEMKGMAVVHNLAPADRSLAEALPGHEAQLRSAAAELGSVAEIRTHLGPRPVDEFEPFVAGLAAGRAAPG